MPDLTRSGYYNFQSVNSQPTTGYELAPAGGMWKIGYPEAATNLLPDPSFENPNWSQTGGGFISSSFGSGGTSILIQNATAVGGTNVTDNLCNLTNTNALFGRKALFVGMAKYQEASNLTKLAVYFSNFANIPGFNLLSASKAYTFSFYLLANTQFRFQFQLGLSSVVPLDIFSPTFTYVPGSAPGLNGYQRFSFSFTLPSSFVVNINPYIYINLPDYVQTAILDPVNPYFVQFYTDGWQLEQSGHSTFYCDGDQPGCYWSGTPYFGSSVRVSQAQSGIQVYPGNELDLKSLGIKITEVKNFGLPSIQHINIPNAFLSGGKYQRSVSQQQIISLTGMLESRKALEDLHRVRQRLINLFAPDPVQQQSNLISIRYTPVDPCGMPLGNQLELLCYYLNGLEGDFNNLFSEKLTLQFIRYNSPGIQELFDNYAGLGINTSFSAAQNTAELYRPGATGAWTAYTFASGTATNAIDQRNIYYGGTGAINLVKPTAPTGWNTPTAYTAGKTVTALYSFDNPASGANHYFFVGSSTSPYLQLYSQPTTAYTTVTVNNTVKVIVGSLGYNAETANAPFGSVLLGGDFTTVGSGPTTAYRLAGYSNNTTSFFAPAIGPAGTFVGVDGSVLAIACRPDTISCYVAGSFQNMVNSSGTAVLAVGGIFQCPTTLVSGNFNTLNGGVNTAGGALINALAIDGYNQLYAAGSFASIGGITASNIARWNGVAWQPLGNGLDNTVTSIWVDLKTNYVYACGAFTGKVAYWNGATWQRLNIYFGTATLTANMIKGASATLPAANQVADVYLAVSGFASAGDTGYSPATTTVQYNGTAPVYPDITITGPGTLRQISNQTSGKTVYFNYTMVAGETVTFVTNPQPANAAALGASPQNNILVSSLVGPITGRIVPGSDVGFLAINPGTNVFSAFIEGSTAATSVVMKYRNLHWSFDGAVQM